MQYNVHMSVLSFVDRWLPPPKSLRLSGLGVDISESSIKYIGFEPSYTGLSSLALTHWGEVNLKPDILSRGEIKDVTGLADAIGEVKARTGASYVRLSLPEERVYLFETEIDEGINLAEVRGLIEFRLEENVPVSPRDAYFDYHLGVSGAEGKLMASVTVCTREIVDVYYEACQKAGVTPISFEVESQALARSVLPESDQGTKLLVDFGKTRTGLGIVHQGMLLYTSTIEMGGNDLSAALRRQLGDKEESEFSRIKNEQGLVKGAGETSFNDVLLPPVSSIKDEIQARIGYWRDRYGPARPIEELILCGGSANLRGLPDYLNETLGVYTTMADVWQNAFDVSLNVPPIDKRHSYGYGTAIGLALASFSDNL